MKTKLNKKGFTLVELSIVLVIIGLLIGGILVAQSMIGTAKVQSGVRQLGQYDAAIANFYTKFNSLPGDFNGMGATAGDGNGYIMATSASGGTAVPTAFFYEVGKFWSDLSASGLKPTGTATAYTDTSAGPAAASTLVNTLAPAFPVGTNLAIVPFGKTATDNNGITGNYYMINSFSAAITSGALTATPASSLKPADAAAVDAKIDDGIAAAGNILGSDTTGLVRGTPTGTTCLTTAGTAATTYTYANNTVASAGCGLAVRFGLQTGNLQ